MTSRPPPGKLMIMDACVLIDFIKAERVVLELVVKHIGSLYVTSSVVDEVNEIDDENELIALGLTVIEPEIEDAYAAGVQSGRLSFEDWLCMLTARRGGFTCVTNDRNLRKLCRREGVPLLWGLELVAELHKLGGITGVARTVLLNPSGSQIRNTFPRISSGALQMSSGARRMTGPGSDPGKIASSSDLVNLVGQMILAFHVHYSPGFRPINVIVPVDEEKSAVRRYVV